MTDDEITELLREFRARVPEPSAEERALASARVAAALAARGGRRPRFGPAARRLRPRIGVSLGLVTAATAVGLLVAAPWQNGALAPAQAATVLRRVAAVSAPRHGWLFHERTLTLSAGKPRLIRETWREDANPYRFRIVSRLGSSAPVEVGGTLNPRAIYVYDGATRRLYRNPRQLPLNRGRFVDEATALRAQIAGKPVTPQGGHWKVLARTRLGDRKVYKLELVMPPPVGYVGLTYYVDQKTYVPVEIVSRSLVSSWLETTRVLTYEHLPRTDARKMAADIRAQHADAMVVSGERIPASLLAQLESG